MRNRYSTPPAAVVSNPPAFAARRQMVSAKAKRSSSVAPPSFVAHQLAERKEIMKAGQARSREIGFSSGAALLFFLKYDFLTEKLSLLLESMFVEIDQAIRPPELGNKLGPFRNYLGSFDAITSIFSIEGDFARSSAAFSLRACATLPFKCASRPESSVNVSKIP